MTHAERERLFGGIRQMPQIFIEGQRVGGLAGLQAALKELGL
jgi:glutaredoxin 3